MGRNFHRKPRVPFDVLLYAFLAVAAGIVGVTATVTATEYPNLPDRVPLHFRLDGKPSSFWPRPAIWIVVGVQTIASATMANAIAIVTAAHNRPPSPLGIAVFGVCIVGALALGQLTILATAKSTDQRLPVGTFLAQTGALFVLAFLSMRFL